MEPGSVKFSSVKTCIISSEARHRDATRPSTASSEVAASESAHKKYVPPPFVQAGHTFQRDAISVPEIDHVDSQPTTRRDFKRLAPLIYFGYRMISNR